MTGSRNGQKIADARGAKCLPGGSTTLDLEALPESLGDLTT
ncbi:hypothetical protein ABZU75_26215 [Streptosporangium sp. NPDC005286]